MIRVIVREVNSGAAAHVGGPVDVSWKTFDFNLPKLEAHLRGEGNHVTREVVGVEVVSAPEAL